MTETSRNRNDIFHNFDRSFSVIIFNYFADNVIYAMIKVYLPYSFRTVAKLTKLIITPRPQVAISIWKRSQITAPNWRRLLNETRASKMVQAHEHAQR